MHVVVIQTAFLGDLILSTPLLKQLKERLNCKISLIARQGMGKLLKDLHLVDEFYPIEKGNKKSYRLVAEKLNLEEVDHLLCPHESFRSAVLASKVKVKGKRVGFRRWWSPLLFHRTLAKPYALPDALRQLSLLTLIDEGFEQIWRETNFTSLRNSEIIDSPIDFRNTEVPTWASMVLDNFEVGESRDKTVLIAPGSVWNTKKWTEQGFKEVSQFFLKSGFSIRLIGSQAEYEICERVKAGNSNIENRAGKDSLLESLKLMKKSSLLISNDSGAMHLASLVNLPTVTVFGPTVLKLGYRPWNQNAIAVQKDLRCRPCGKHGHQVCPIGTHECMKGLSAQMVIEEAKKLVLDN